MSLRAARWFFPLLVLASPALAEGPAAPAAPAAPAPPPSLATTDEARQALDRFQGAFKAEGLKRDEKLAMREQAVRELAKVQHPLVADRLLKLAQGRDADLRTIGVMYLGEQKALPGYAAKGVIAAMQKASNDVVFVMFCSDAMELNYRGQVETLRALLAGKNDTIRKHVLMVIGDMKEMRLVEDVVKLMIELKIDKGIKWEGGSVSVDTGAPGNADQEAAEAAYHAAHANDPRAKGAGRRMRDLKPTLLEAMKALTGQEFLGGKQAEEWLAAHEDEVTAKKAALDRLEKEQRQAAVEHEALTKPTSR